MTKYPFVDLGAQIASIRGELDEAIQRVIREHRFINGPDVKAFNTAYAAFCGVAHCVGCTNGTLALQALLQCSGIGPGDEVICPSHTFIATIESIRHTGATPVMVEVEDSNCLIDPAAVAAAVTPRTKAIVPVHLYGCPARMDALKEIASKSSLLLLEDAAQAQGAALHGVRAGALGDGASFSFFPGKNLGAFGDAGAVTTNDAQLARRVKLFVNHGREDKYTHMVDGTNFRLDTLQAAILHVKLAHLEKWNANRRRLAMRYHRLLAAEPFAGWGVRMQSSPVGAESVFHIFLVRIPSRDKVRDALEARGIETGIHYPIPCHLQPALAYLGVKPGSLPVTEKICNEILSLPMYPEMPDSHVDDVVAILAEELRKLG